MLAPGRAARRTSPAHPRKQPDLLFEQLIVDLLVTIDYDGSHKDAAAQLGRSGDGGVDRIVNEDRLGLNRIYAQAKR